MSEFKAVTSSETSQARADGLDESDDQLDSEGEQKYIPQPTTKIRNKVPEKQTHTAQLVAFLEEAAQKVKQMASLEDQLKSAEGEAEQMKAEIKNKEMEVGKIADENETLKNEIKRSRADLAVFETLSRETNAKLKECRKSLETANWEKKQLEKTREEQGATIKKYKIDMEACKLLVKELQTELEKCQQETMEAVNAQSDAYKTLTDILPRLAPKPEKQRFSAPGNEFTSPATPDAQKRPLPESQSELPGNITVAILQRKRPRAKTVVNEYHRNYNLTPPQRKDNNDDVKKFYQCKDKDKMVYRDGFVYVFQCNLKCNPPWKDRMWCSHHNRKPRCNGAIWTKGEWEKDELGRVYQCGILKGSHSHDAQEQFFTQHETSHIGGTLDDQ